MSLIPEEEIQKRTSGLIQGGVFEKVGYQFCYDCAYGDKGKLLFNSVELVKKN